MDARRFRDFVNEYGNPGLKITFKGIQSNNDYLDLNEESILKSYGYSVSQSEGLSFTKRVAILTELVDLQIVSIPKIVSLLDFFIISHPSAKDYHAREKWIDDKNYHEISVSPTITCNYIHRIDGCWKIVGNQLE